MIYQQKKFDEHYFFNHLHLFLAALQRLFAITNMGLLQTRLLALNPRALLALLA